MPLNSKQSYEELSKYSQFHCSFHSAYELSSENFIKVPPKTIIVSTYHDNEISSYDHPALYIDLILKENYLVHSLLTENDDIPEYHKFHNKTIYMPGSCIPNISLEFLPTSEDDTAILGIFNIKDIYHKKFTNEKNVFIPNDFQKVSIVNDAEEDEISDLTLEDMIQIIRDYNPDEYGYIIFIDGCTHVNYYSDCFLDESKIPKAFKNKICKDTDKNNRMKLSIAYTKYNRRCVLDSLQKFTANFSFYDKDKEKLPIDFSDYHGYSRSKNFNPVETYKKKYKKEIRDVDRYFSKLSDVGEELNEDEYYEDVVKKTKGKIFYNKSGESVGSLGVSPLSMSVSGTGSGKDENLFDKYFKKQVNDIISPKDLTLKKKKSPKKSQTLRRSSRIASSRKMYDGKKSKRSRRYRKKSKKK